MLKKVKIRNNKETEYEKLYKKCNNNEACWVDQEFVDNKKVVNVFKPKRPKGKYKWLSTYDIRNAMKQYEKVYPDFEFLGPVPIDFDK